MHLRTHSPERSPSHCRSARAAIVMAFGVLFLLGSGCSRVAVHTMADPDTDFATYATFDFLPDGGSSEHPRNLPPHLRMLGDPLYKAHVQEAIDSRLTAKGMRRVRGPQKPDLLVGYRTVVRDQADVMPAVYGVGWRGRVYVARPGHVRWYKEGTLVVDIIDTAGEHLVWRGVGVGAMRDLKPGPDLVDAIGEILAGFPPD